MNHTAYTLIAILLLMLTTAFANAQSSPPPTTHVMVTLSLIPEAGERPEVIEQRLDEVKATASLYLDGKITQWYFRGDGGGVILIMNVNSVEEAEALVNNLPYRRLGAVTAEFVPLSPMVPLRALLAE